MFRRYVAGFLIRLTVAMCVERSAEALEPAAFQHASTAAAAELAEMRPGVLESDPNAGLKPRTAAQQAHLEAKVYLPKPFGGTAMAAPQTAPAGTTGQKPQSRTKHTVKLVVITLAVLAGVAVIVGLLDRKSECKELR